MYALCQPSVRDLSTIFPSPEERARVLAKAGVNADGVINRLRLELKIETDSDLARTLGVSKTTVSTWRKRNSIPYDHVAYYAILGLIDIDFVLTGRGRFSPNVDKSESIKNKDIDYAFTEYLLSEITPLDRNRESIKYAAELFITYRDGLISDLSDVGVRLKGAITEPNYKAAGGVIKLLRRLWLDENGNVKPKEVDEDGLPSG